MVVTDRVQEMFGDAKATHWDALVCLAAGDVRDAAERAWAATRMATDGLVLARTGWLPESSRETSSGLRDLSSKDVAIRRLRLVARYYTRQGHLHGDCFYCGLCEPLDDTERRIRETGAYITDAEGLA